MRTALEEVAVAADQVAADQQQVARQARAMQRLRDRGWSWTRILDQQPGPALVDLLRHSRRHLAAAAALAGRALAVGLSNEGSSRRQIAGRLGVTHQRVTAILGDAQPPSHLAS